jgi:hypothetical protein
MTAIILSVLALAYEQIGVLLTVLTVVTVCIIIALFYTMIMHDKHEKKHISKKSKK